MMCKNSFWRYFGKTICLVFVIWSCGTFSAQAKKEIPLNVGSFNIRCNTTADGENAWPYRKDRVMALIAFYEYDIIGVQEARPEQMADMKQMTEYASVGVGRDGEQGGEFSAIFYRTDRIQILDSGTFWLSETPEVVTNCVLTLPAKVESDILCDTEVTGPTINSLTTALTSRLF